MKCALYIRVSNDKAIGKISEHYQRELLFKTIQEKGWSIYQCYVDLFPLQATHGSSLQKMLSDAEEMKFDAILTTSVSRLARNRNLLNKLSKHSEINGIRIITFEDSRTEVN